jgi:hypothetical protein
MIQDVTAIWLPVIVIVGEMRSSMGMCFTRRTPQPTGQAFTQLMRSNYHRTFFDSSTRSGYASIVRRILFAQTAR